MGDQPCVYMIKGKHFAESVEDQDFVSMTRGKHIVESVATNKGQISKQNNKPFKLLLVCG